MHLLHYSNDQFMSHQVYSECEVTWPSQEFGAVMAVGRHGQQPVGGPRRGSGGSSGSEGARVAKHLPAVIELGLCMNQQ